ncbi:MAG: Gfo/Idh/MocA family oxidoreductase [Oscillospiraceae bacterium]|nr:Gfo/Idh/MocA family oxidoreductase [Oscillospiraceae bacterium]
MNVLMIGAGDIAKSHGRAVVKLGGKVIAAFDVNEAGLKRYADEFGCEMLSYEQIEEYVPKADYVVLCTPPTKRLDYVEMVLKHHVPLYMEKPIATSIEDARKIKDMEQKYDGKIIVGFAHFYRPAFQKMLELVESGALGDPISVFDNRVGPGYGFRGTWFQPSWRTDPKFACGFTIESISHEWNLLTALCGEFETLSANTWCTIESLPTYDTNCSATMKIKKGGVATINASWSSDLGGNWKGYIGTRGTCFLRGSDMFEFDEVTWKTSDMAQAETLHFNDSYKHDQDGVIFNIHQYFQDCLKTGKPIRTPLDEGIKVLKLSMLALESSREHKEIILDERM